MREQQVTHPQKYRVDYGEWAFDYDLSEPGKLSYTGVTEAVSHIEMTVDVAVTPVAPDVYVVSFVEPTATVVSVQDFAQCVVNTWLTIDNALSHMQGKLILQSSEEIPPRGKDSLASASTTNP